MISEYKEFIFESYFFDDKTKILTLNYSLDGSIKFREKYTFDFEFSEFDQEVLDRAIQDLFFIAGISYYKTYIPPKITVRTGRLDEYQARFFSNTYQKGLGEFWYINGLDPTTSVDFPVNSKSQKVLKNTGNGLLVGIGGGKDSLVTVELLQKQAEVKTWSLNHRSQLEPLVETIGTQHYYVDREWDAQLASIAEKGGLNGHIPVSAIFATVGTIVAILTGNRDSITSNEQSANEATLSYKNVDINHQYSKSQQFERDYQRLLAHNFGDSLRYYSFLRPMSELLIAELFSKIGWHKYKDVFSSCNRAYIQSSDRMSWCGGCPKCAFVFLILSPFIERTELEDLWKGKNLLLNPGQEKTYKQLLGIDDDKPLECVGEVQESRQAMKLAQAIYPELKKFVCELPGDYDFRALSTHEMPEEIYEIFSKAVKANL